MSEFIKLVGQIRVDGVEVETWGNHEVRFMSGPIGFGIYEYSDGKEYSVSPSMASRAYEINAYITAYSGLAQVITLVKKYADQCGIYSR